MSRIVIDSETGTIIDITNAYVVDLNDLDPLDVFELDEGGDSDISRVAVRRGIPLAPLFGVVS